MIIFTGHRPVTDEPNLNKIGSTVLTHIHKYTDLIKKDTFRTEGGPGNVYIHEHFQTCIFTATFSCVPRYEKVKHNVTRYQISYQIIIIKKN
jgi:hypothetical protein